jgi:quinol monooxygenase YgiN
MPAMIVLSGTFTVKPEHEGELVAMANALLPLSRAEPGCLRYDFLKDALGEQRFMFFELWKTREDLEAHFKKSYFKAFGERLPLLIVGQAEIVTYESSGPVPAF